MITVELAQEGVAVVMRPSWEEVVSAVRTSAERVVTSGQGVGRVEPRIFPGMVKEELHLRAAAVDDEEIAADVTYVCDVVARNSAGPLRYIDTYAPFLRFLSAEHSASSAESPSSEDKTAAEDEGDVRAVSTPSEAEVAIDAFLAKSPSLEKVVAYITQLRDTRSEVMSMRAVVPMELFRLDGTALHARLIENIDGLIQKAITWVATRNMQRNESLCARFQAITERLTTRPADTDAMAALEVTPQPLFGGP